jgi:hypothetical protein
VSGGRIFVGRKAELEQFKKVLEDPRGLKSRRNIFSLNGSGCKVNIDKTYRRQYKGSDESSK